jgi:hypothetical protein
MVQTWHGPRWVPEIPGREILHGSCGCCGCTYYAGETIRDTLEIIDQPVYHDYRETMLISDRHRPLDALERKTHKRFPDGARLEFTLDGLPSSVTYKMGGNATLPGVGPERQVSFHTVTITGFSGLNGDYQQNLPRSQYGCFMRGPQTPFVIQTTYRGVSPAFTLINKDHTFPNTGYLSPLCTFSMTDVVTTDRYSHSDCVLLGSSTDTRTVDLLGRLYYRIQRGVTGDEQLDLVPALINIEVGIVFSRVCFSTRRLWAAFYPSFAIDDPNGLRLGRLAANQHELEPPLAEETLGDLITDSVGFDGSTLGDELSGDIVWRYPAKDNVFAREKPNDYDFTICGTQYKSDMAQVTGTVGSYSAKIVRL